MSFWDALNQTLSEDLALNIMTGVIGFFIFIGYAMFAYIQIKDSTLLTDLFFKHKNFNHKQLNELMRAQAVITATLNVIILFMSIALQDVGLVLLILILSMFVLNVIYTFIAVHVASKEVIVQNSPNQL